MFSSNVNYIMTLTLTQRSAKVKRRKSALRRSGHTYADLAGLARVTYSMAWKFMNGERKSTECERAFDTLTASTGG
jgi:hypothetical protein